MSIGALAFSFVTRLDAAPVERPEAVF